MSAPSGQATSSSSALLYSEYLDTSESKNLGCLFKKMPKKPVIKSYGESPLYKKYSDLLKKLEESKDVYPAESDENSPIIQIDCLLKQKTAENTDDDEEEIPIVFPGTGKGSDEDSSDNETSSDEEYVSNKFEKKIEVIEENVQNKTHKDTKCDLEENTFVVTKDNITSKVCNSALDCLNNPVSYIKKDETEFEPVSKKLKTDKGYC